MLQNKKVRISILSALLLGFFLTAILNFNKLSGFLKKVVTDQKQSSSLINTEKNDGDDDLKGALWGLNLYLSGQNMKTILKQDLVKIDNSELFEKLKSGDDRSIILDIREKYEWSINRLTGDAAVKYIRLGDVLSGKLENIPVKEQEIVIVGFGETRASLAAYSLISQGYTNVKVLKGGILKWAMDNFPMEINNYQKDKDISKILKYFSDKDIKIHGGPVVLISFGPANLEGTLIQPIFWDTQKLTAYINSLSKDKKYVISCGSRKYCYEALYFWYDAKDVLNIVGYTTLL